jgi:hypothetical protein
MNLILGFAPFILFFLLSRLSADVALWAAFAAAFMVTIRDFVESPSLRLLDVGNLTIFGGLALVRGFLLPGLSPAAVRFLAELALLVLLAGSIALRRPFSLQYARISPSDEWPRALFRRVNYMTSIVWLAAFAAMAFADAAAALLPLPLTFVIATGALALGLAVLFTLRYPPMMAQRLARG